MESEGRRGERGSGALEPATGTADENNLLARSSVTVTVTVIGGGGGGE